MFTVKWIKLAYMYTYFCVEKHAELNKLLDSKALCNKYRVIDVSAIIVTCQAVLFISDLRSLRNRNHW
jgi:hypothetical protein